MDGWWNTKYWHPKQTEPDCSFDEMLEVIVHRFDMGHSVCRCGKKEVVKPERKGWREIYGGGKEQEKKK